MPFEKANDVTNVFVPSNNPSIASVTQEQEQYNPGFFETAGASFAMYNPVTSAVVNNSTLSIFDNYDPNYDPEDDIGDFEDYSDILLSAKDRSHMMRLKKDIRRKERYENIINNAGAVGITTSLAAGLLDPVGLYAFGSAGKIKKATQITNVSKAGKVASTTAKYGAIGAGSIALSEAALQVTQPSLEAEESFKAIAAGALLGGLLGGWAGRLEIKEFESLSRRLKNDFENINGTRQRIDDFNIKMVDNYNSTAGAAQVQKFTMDDLTLVDSLGFAKLTRYINPTLRVMQSPFLTARDTYVKLADVPLALRATENNKAIPPSVEDFAKLYDTNLAKAVRSENSGYKNYKNFARQRGEKIMPRGQYRKRVSQALRRGDQDVIGNNAEITKTAQEIRKNFLDPLKDAAIKVGVFPEDIQAKFAESYLTRMWNPKAIVENRDKFQEKIYDWAYDKTRSEIQRVGGIFNKKINKVNQDIEGYKDLIRTNKNRIKELSQRDTTRFDYRNLSSVKDDYLEFLKREIGLQEVGAYLARYELEDVAELVNRAKVRIPQRPLSLVSEIVKKGGIKPDADLKAKDITNKVRPGLFNNNGQNLDVMMRELIDDGYFPEFRGITDKPEEFMMDDLRNAIEDDLYGQGVYKDKDLSLVDEINQLEELQQEAEILLSQAGITDYKNFYKNIYEDIKLSKRDLRNETKAERQRIKAARQAAREAQKATKPLRDELKSMRNAEISSLNRQNSKIETRIKRTQKKLDEIESQKKLALDRYLNANDDEISEYVQEQVDEITNTLSQVKSQPDLPPYVTPIARGPLKEKLLDVDDVEFEEFLENDVRAIMDYYRHHMGTQIELKRAFGNINLKQQLDEIEDEYNNLIRGKSAKEARKLTKQYKSVRSDIEGVRDILLGNYNRHTDPDSMLQQSGVVLRDVQFMSKMGGVTVSSLPDFLRVPMVSGFSNWLEAGKIKAASKELKKMTTEELEDASIALESVLSSRLQTLAEIGDPLNRGSAFTRFTGNSANVFSKFTIINYWNDMNKSLSAITTQLRIKKALERGNDKKFLLSNGIDDFYGDIIKQQIQKHGKQNIVGLKDWDIEDPNVFRASMIYKSALRKNADKAIVTKGAGDLPLMTQTPLGKVIFQFRSFLLASHNRVFLPAIQTKSSKEAAAVILASSAMVAMGMLIAATKSELYNRSAGLRGADSNFDTSEWNKRKWILEGIDRSGLVALMLEPLHIADKATGLGPSMLTGQGQTSRYASRNVLGSLLGPSAGTVGDAAISMRALASPITGADVSKSDIYAARRIMPYQNAFIFRQMFDILERETGEAIGAQ